MSAEALETGSPLHLRTGGSPLSSVMLCLHSILSPVCLPRLNFSRQGLSCVVLAGRRLTLKTRLVSASRALGSKACAATAGPEIFLERSEVRQNILRGSSDHVHDSPRLN